MADDSQTKTFLRLNRLKLDFKGLVLLIALAGLILISLVFVTAKGIPFFDSSASSSKKVASQSSESSKLETASDQSWFRKWFTNTQWVTVQTVTFSPNGELYDQGRWHPVPLSAGKYRLQIANTTFQQSVGESEHEGYRPVPIRGIPLNHWNNHPFQGEFVQNAPVPSVGVGAVVVRLDKKPYPLNSTFFLPNQNTIDLGVNLLPYRAAYERNVGEITVAIQKEIEE